MIDPILELLCTCTPENISLAEALAEGAGVNIPTLLKDAGLNNFDIYDVDTLPKTDGANKIVINGDGFEHIDLSLISLFVNLNSLTISRAMVDLKQLIGLNNLEYLSIVINYVEDISPLAALKSLRTLRLHSNHISDISPLAKLQNLEDLSLFANQISDISPLAKMTKLKELDLFDNKISDITAIQGLVNIERLNLSYNPIPESQFDILVELCRKAKNWRFLDITKTSFWRSFLTKTFPLQLKIKTHD